LCTVSRGSAQSAAPLAILSGLPAAAGGVFARAAENQPRARRARSPADRPRVYRRLPRGGSRCRIGNGSDPSLVTAIAPGTAYVEQFSPLPPSPWSTPPRSSPPDSACSLWAWTCCAEHFHSVPRERRHPLCVRGLEGEVCERPRNRLDSRSANGLSTSRPQATSSVLEANRPRPANRRHRRDTADWRR
jgi:hypothetical protein